MKNANFKIFKVGVFGLLLFASLAVFPIGRSGDGKSVSSVELGFETIVPKQYSQSREYRDGTLRIYFFGFGSSVSVKEKSLLFQPLAAVYPELVGLGRDAAAEVLKKSQGQLVMTKDPCIQAYHFESTNLVYTVFQWAPEKGVVVMGERDSITEQSLNQIESELELLPGACGWN